MHKDMLEYQFLTVHKTMQIEGNARKNQRTVNGEEWLGIEEGQVWVWKKMKGVEKKLDVVVLENRPVWEMKL